LSTHCRRCEYALAPPTRTGAAVVGLAGKAEPDVQGQ
jgi:hypothetical protein